MADDPPADTGPTTAELAARQDTLDGKLDQVLAVLGRQPASPAAPGQPDAAPSVAEEIRQQLEERDRKAAADQAAAEKDGRLAALEASLKEMTEKPPAPPVRRIEKIMGWH